MVRGDVSTERYNRALIRNRLEISGRAFGLDVRQVGLYRRPRQHLMHRRHILVMILGERSDIRERMRHPVGVSSWRAVVRYGRMDTMGPRGMASGNGERRSRGKLGCRHGVGVGMTCGGQMVHARTQVVNLVFKDIENI